MSEKCPKCNRAAEYYIPSEGSRPTPGACYLTDGEDCLRRQLAHAKRELEQSRQREAAAVAKLALVSAWLEGPELTHQSGMDDYYCYADECDLDRLEAILDGETVVLAVDTGKWSGKAYWIDGSGIPMGIGEKWPDVTRLILAKPSDESEASDA